MLWGRNGGVSIYLNARHIGTRTNRHQDISALRQIGTGL